MATRKTPARLAHEKDMETLGRLLREAAEEHDLCDTFYDVMASINKKLSVPVLIERPGLTGYVSVNVNVGMLNFVVTGAEDEYEARKSARDAVERAVESIINDNEELLLTLIRAEGGDGVALDDIEVEAVDYDLVQD